MIALILILKYWYFWHYCIVWLSNIEGINTSSLIALFCSLQARLDILKIHSRKMNLTRGINLRKIAELMPGASGAEVKVRSQDHFQAFMGIYVALIQEKQCWKSVFICAYLTGCLHRGRDVRPEREESPRYPRGFWNGSGKGTENISFFSNLCFSTNNILTCQS